VHFDREPPAGARELLRRSIALLEGAAGPTHPELAAPLRRLGELELREGHPAEALVLLRRSVELSAGILEDPLEAAGLRLLLARALWDGGGGGGDRAEAVELLRGVLEGLPPDSADPERQRVRTDLERWLADHPQPPA
jgi:eukaryotic-like serine/threonine-protein kinase